MASYYTKSAFELELNQEEKAFALQVLTCAKDNDVKFRKSHKTAHERTYPSEVYRIAKKFVASFDELDESEDFYLPFEFCATEDGILFSHDENINTYAAATFCHLILKHFSSDNYVCIEAAHTCSSDRTDGFGGHAAFITKKGIKWMSTRQWMHKNIVKHRKAA